MRIALCFYGLAGSQSSKYGVNKNIDIEIPFKLFKKNLIDLYKGKIDIFLHSQSFEEKNKLLKLYKPKLYKIEEQKDFKYSINHPHLKNLYLLKLKIYFEKLLGQKKSQRKLDYLIKKAYASYSRWYSLQQSVQLKRKYETKMRFDYDLVFITRYDIIIKKKYYLHKFDNSKLTVPHHNTIPGPLNNYKSKPLKDNRTNYKGISDLWFASSSKNMDNFANLFDRITQYPISPHYSSYNHAKHLNLDLDFKFYRYFDHELLRRMNMSKE